MPFQATRTVKVRRISYADIERLAHGEPLEAFRLMADGLAPLTITPRPTHSKSDQVLGACGVPVPDAELDERSGMGQYKAVPNSVVGHLVQAEIVSPFGTSGSVALATTPAAEQSLADRKDSPRVAQSRMELVVEDQDGTETMQTVPVYGAQVTMTVFVRGVGDQEAQAAVESAVHDAFGPAVHRIHGLKARPVHDHRVDALVYSQDVTRDEPVLIATNVLASEASYFVVESGHSTNGFLTRPTNARGNVIVGGD